MKPALMGIEIGGTKLQVVVGDAAGGIRQRMRFAVEPDAGGAGIRASLEEALTAIVRAHQPAAVGVGFGGPVDWRSGIIRCSHQIAGWADFPLGEWVGGLTGLPVAVDNDANVAALGEARAGVGRGQRVVFYVTLGSGVGGGLVVDGAIYHGASPGESEIGHVRLDRSGTTVESRCSGWAVDGRIREWTRRQPEGVLAQLTAGVRGGEARHLGEALRLGDPVAQRILGEVAEDLAHGLSHGVHLMHPERIVLGGGLALLGEPLRAAVAEALPGMIMEVFRPGPSICLAALAENAVPVGALLLAGDRWEQAGK